MKICVFTQEKLRFTAIKLGIYTDVKVIRTTNFVSS